MRLSFSTLGCPGWEIDEVMDAAVKYGYGALEIRGIGDIMRTERIPCLFPENREATLSALRERGLEIICFGTSCAFDTPEKYESAIEEGRAATEVAFGMGAPFIRVFGNGITSEDGARETEAVIRGVGELCRYAREIAKREGNGAPAVEILLEVHGDFNTVERLLPICSALDGQNFGLIWDYAHSDRAGENHSDFLRALSPYIKHVHVKDHKRRADGKTELCSQGEGDIPVKETVREMLAEGYGGYFSLEYEKRWHPELPDTESELKRYVEYMNEI